MRACNPPWRQRENAQTHQRAEFSALQFIIETISKIPDLWQELFQRYFFPAGKHTVHSFGCLCCTIALNLFFGSTRQGFCVFALMRNNFSCCFRRMGLGLGLLPPPLPVQVELLNCIYFSPPQHVLHTEVRVWAALSIHISPKTAPGVRVGPD